MAINYTLEPVDQTVTLPEFAPFVSGLDRYANTKWQQAPKAPTMAGADNYDNFDDTDRGARSSGYYDIPWPLDSNHYGTVRPVAPGIANGAAFLTAYNAAAAGDVIVLQDGVHDIFYGGTWGGGAMWLYNSNGTKENPIYIVAETPGGAIIQNTDPMLLQCESNNHVIAGIRFENSTSSGGPLIYARREGLRFTGLEFINNISTPFANVSTYAQGINTNNIRIDNCTYDAGGSAQAAAFFSFQAWDGRVAGQVTNPVDFWIHNNSFINGAPGGGNDDLFAVGLNGYKVDEDTTTNYNVLKNNCYMLFENNLVDTWPVVEGLFQIKGGTVIFRNNTLTEITGAMMILRMSNNVLWHGNWQHEYLAAMRISADVGHAVFNYIEGGGTCFLFHQGQVTTDQHPTAGEGVYEYMTANDWKVQYNVISRANGLVETYAQAGPAERYTLKAQPTGNIIQDNDIHSTAMFAKGDTSANYWDPGGEYSYPQFVTNNTWGANNYINANLVSTGAVDAALFDGPGSDFVVDTPTDYWGEPTIIKMPSYWKQP